METEERTDNFEISEIDPSTWQSMREQVAALVNATMPTEERQRIGNELVQRISQYENGNTFKMDKVGDRFGKIEHNLSELRNLVTSSVTNITGIIRNVARVEDNNRKFADRIATLEEKLTIVENVNVNFRKMLTLENEFLRELLKTDNKTITNLRKKLQNLRLKLEEISNRAGVNRSNILALTETVFREDDRAELQEAIGQTPAESSCTAIQTVDPANMAIITEWMARSFPNQNILAVLENIKNSAT